MSETVAMSKQHSVAGRPRSTAGRFIGPTMETLERRATVVRLRNAGVPWSRCGEQMGIDPSACRRHFRAAIDDLARQTREETERLRGQSLAVAYGIREQALRLAAQALRDDDRAEWTRLALVALKAQDQADDVAGLKRVPPLVEVNVGPEPAGLAALRQLVEGAAAG